MLKKIALATGTALIALSSTAALSKPTPPEPVVMTVDADAAAARNVNPLDKLKDFALKKPLIELPQTDPARQAVAEQVMGKLLSDGSYRRIMETAQKDLLQPLLDRVWTMKGSEATALFGVKDLPQRSKDETFAQAFGKDDPYAKPRFEAYMTTYFGLIADMGSAIEPDVRKAMARDFARKYDLAQLTEMNRFFATPTGSLFARDYMTSTLSLDVLQTSLMVWPKMVEAVPDFATRWEKADAHLPPRPVPTQAPPSLPQCAQDGDESDCSDADWATTAIASSDEPWTDPKNWTAAEKSKVDKLEAAYELASDKSSSAYEAYDAAQTTAIDAARERMIAAGWKPTVTASAPDVVEPQKPEDD